MEKNIAVPQRKNRLLFLFRKYHSFIGLIAAVFLCIVGLTGAVLNYKKSIFGALGLESDGKLVKENQGRNFNIGSVRIDNLPVSFAHALEVAKQKFNDENYEKIELKCENGVWVYKIKIQGKGELWINAETGESFKKGEYKKAVIDGSGRPLERGTDWGKLLIDLHTGKIGGEFGKALITFVAICLLFLSVSGVYVYLKPLFMRNKNGLLRRTVHSRSQEKLTAME
ncbi:MAG: PepSY domain-containing protein [Verrucomicrobiae bacterium]|nr:PepSY domain-containing protein [Verrucomicrobiae bacterium]